MLKNLQALTTCVSLSLTQYSFSQVMPRAIELSQTISPQTSISQQQISQREKIGSPDSRLSVDKNLNGDYSFAHHPTKPVLPYYLVLSGCAALKPGQLDVVKQVAPVVAQSLGLGFKIKIDSKFEKAIRKFQAQHNLNQCGEINQETLFKLIELGKLHCSKSPARLIVCDGSNLSENIEARFDLSSSATIVSRQRRLALTAPNAEGAAFLSQIRKGLSLQPAGVFDGQMEVAILKFRLANMPTLIPHGEVATDLISEMHKQNLIRIYQVSEEPVLFSLTFSDGLLPEKRTEILEVADRLFSGIAPRARETELALHTSGTYSDFLEDLLKIQIEENNQAEITKIRMMRKALEIGIDLPARIINSDIGESESLHQFIRSDLKFDPRRSSYLILTPIADHNAVFNSCIPEILPENLGVNLIYSDIDSEEQMRKTLIRCSADRKTKISLLVSLGHGAEDGISLGIQSHPGSLGRDFDFSNYSESFENNAVWVMNSCLTANDKGSPKNSFAYCVSQKIPQIYVVAYKEKVDRPKTYVRNSLSDVYETISNLPANSRYFRMPDGRFLITSSMNGEVPVVIKNGELVRDFLLSDLSAPRRLSPEHFDERVDLFKSDLPKLPRVENFFERALFIEQR